MFCALDRSELEATRRLPSTQRRSLPFVRVRRTARYSTKGTGTRAIPTEASPDEQREREATQLVTFSSLNEHSLARSGSWRTSSWYLLRVERVEIVRGHIIGTGEGRGEVG